MSHFTKLEHWFLDMQAGSYYSDLVDCLTAEAIVARKEIKPKPENKPKPHLVLKLKR